MAAALLIGGIDVATATTVLDETNARELRGASSTTNAEDSTLLDVKIGQDERTDLDSFSTWLDSKKIAHEIVQDPSPSDATPEQGAQG